MIIYNSGNIDVPTLKKAIEKKLTANTRVKKLLDYYEGRQEILTRYYSDPTKPNNRIVVNYCKDCADFLTSYLVGVPVKYEGADPDLVRVLDYNDDPQAVQSAVEYMNIAGFCCELFYTDEDGEPRYTPLNPLECIVFMNDDLQRDITAFCRVVELETPKGGYAVTLYTATTTTEYKMDTGTGSLTPLETKPHYWGDVPVNLYENGEAMQGSFEQAIPIQDALNKVYSDNVNDFEQFVDAYLVLEGMTGTQAEDIENMKWQRVLLPPPDSKAYWLTKSVDKSHIKQLQDDLRTAFLETCNVPDVKELSGMGGDASGVSIRMKLIKTETQAGKQENAVKKAILRKVELLYNILSLSHSGKEYTGVTPKFTRNYLMYADSQESYAKTLTLLSSGIIADWEARSTILGEDEDTAKKRLPKLSDLMNGEEGEIDYE